MQIRVASEDDFDLVAALDLTGFATPHRIELLLARLRTGDGWVAEENSNIVGYALRGQFFGFDFLELIYVAESLRRAGVASALVKAFEHARRTARLFVSTNRSNMPMQALLNKRGYSPSGVIYNLDADDPELVFIRRYDGEAVEIA